MISPITDPTLFGSTTTSASTPKKSLDKDAFMTLLIAQLKNQDPMNPAQATELASQLAQFTTVEQLTTLNGSVASQDLALHESTLLSKTSLSASLIGRNVVTAGNELTVPTSGQAQIRVEVGTGGGQATLRLLDDSGNEVATRSLGVVPGGLQTLTLPNDLPAGTYHYELTVKGAEDANIAVATYTMGKVTGVSFKDGQIVLHLGSIDVALDDLSEIEPVPVPAST